MTAPGCFVDTETTGLDPDRHEIWEVGLITPDGAEHHWFLSVDESRADLIALNIGGYFDRRPDPVPWFARDRERHDFAVQFQRITRGMHLAGAVVSFDADRLHRLLMAHGVIPAWNYHLIDVEALAVGALAAQINTARDDNAGEDTSLAVTVRESIRPPWSSSWLSAAIGVDPEEFDRHTALGDARWARAIYRAVMGDG